MRPSHGRSVQAAMRDGMGLKTTPLPGRIEYGEMVTNTGSGNYSGNNGKNSVKRAEIAQ